MKIQIIVTISFPEFIIFPTISIRQINNKIAAIVGIEILFTHSSL